MIFNSLPIEICGFEGSLNSLESKLDKFLAKIPGQPPLRGYTQLAASNCIMEQIVALKVEGVS